MENGFDRTLVLRVAYDGSAYSGFAQQEGQPHVRTIAGELLSCMRTLLRRDVELTCAGRTDAGVHARAQYVSIPVTSAELSVLPASRLCRSCSALLPEDIRVVGLYSADRGFSARFDARSRRYRYRLAFGATAPLFCSKWSWWIGRDEPDVDAMALASRALIGEHDFKSFCKASSAVGKPTCRFVSSIEFFEEDALGERLLTMQIEGNAFLHSMVRTLMGTLLEVGLHRKDVPWVARVLEARDRCSAGQCAPARGLTFWDVVYPDGLLQDW